MNAILQCFSQIQELILYFKNNQQVLNTISKYKQMNKNCLTESFKTLIDNLWPKQYDHNHSKNNNNYYYFPYDIKNKISIMNEFKGSQLYDVKELIIFIITTLHQELNIGQDSNQNNINMDLLTNLKNKEFMLNYFTNIFNNENNSIIKDIFYGVIHSYNNCIYCNIINHDFEPYFFLYFPLEEIKKYKLGELNNKNISLNQSIINPNMMSQNMNISQMQNEYQNNLAKIQSLQNNILNISDCFDYNEKTEILKDENILYC